MIGYWMGERFAGKGHMAQAVKLAIPYIFSSLQLHRIEAACIPENHRSIRLLEKAGFQREGYLRGIPENQRAMAGSSNVFPPLAGQHAT